MKILRLDLLAFGPFSNVSLDLSDGGDGLHIVYGPNEAGKSTTLRALRGLLFGMAHQTADNHVHANNDLRIGALLQLDSDPHHQNEPLHVIRRKGRTNTLRQGDDATPVDAKVLAAALGHIDERAFDARFGISHDSLVEGGAEIAQGQGDVGQLLFAASAGIAHLSGLQSQLAEQAESLYKQRGQNPAINAALGKFAEAAKALRTLQLSASDWEQRERDLAEAQLRFAQFEQALTTLQIARTRLERFAAALPLAARRAAVQADLAALGDVPMLAEDFGKRRRDAAEKLRLARHVEQKTAAEIDRLESRFAELGPPPAILDHFDAVAAVCGELSSYLKAAKDRVGLCAEQAQLDARIAAVIERISRKSTDGDELRIVVRTADRARIEELGGKFHVLSARRQSAERNGGQIGRRHFDAAAALAALPAAKDSDSLKRLLRRLQPLQVAETQHAADTARLTAEEQQLSIDVARLPRYSGDLDALERLAVPATEAVERFDDELASATLACANAQRQLEEKRSEFAEIERELRAITATTAAPTDDELAQARQTRDAAWSAIRAAIDSGDANVVAEKAAGFESRLAAADDLADRLRRDAKAVAMRAGLDDRLRKCGDTVAKSEEQLAQAQSEQLAVEGRWKDLWREAGIDPATPRELRAWLAERRRLCDAASAVRKRSAELSSVAKRLADAHSEATAALAELSDRSTGSTSTLAQSLAALESAFDKLEQQREQRRTLEQVVAQSSAELRDLAEELARADADLAAWQSAWSAAVAPLGHDEALSPAQAQAVLSDLSALDKDFDKQKVCAGRIAGIDHDAAEYAARLAEIVGNVASDLDARPLSAANPRSIESIVAELSRRLDAAREAATERRKLIADRERQNAELRQARDEANLAAASMQALCGEAHAAAAEELPQIEEQSRRLADLRGQLAVLDERLNEHAGGLSLEEFLREIADADADQLASEQNRLAEQLAELAERREPLRERIWTLQRDRQQSDGRSDAAEANAQLQALRCQLEEDVGRYALLRLSAAVLRKAIEQYRQKNEAPLLRRASAIFAGLTCGAFSELKTDYDDQQPVLVAVRAETGKAVGVHGMSDGTCDQLYLALRLASVEQYVEQYIDAHPPIPFIVDDVLQRFDDRRAAAALVALAELGKKTQVIFFTHHRHVLDLAAMHLKPHQFSTHMLGEQGSPPPPSATTTTAAATKKKKREPERPALF